ncbi:MAG: 2-oxoglutarate dehydrogenase complex dihydrolipoyllysine-residue succinyltransferase [Gammaproteobacteria bacterium]
MLIDVKVPVLAESVSEATLMTWHKQPGDAVKRGDSLIDIETDKVTLEVSAVDNGVLAEILKEDGAEVQSDEVIARIDTEGKGAAKPAEKAKPAEQNEPKQQSLVDEPEPAASGTTRLSPAVRALLEEHNLDAADIPAGRDDGRLTKEDVLKYLEGKPAASQPAPEPTPAPKPAAEKPEPAQQPAPAAEKSATTTTARPETPAAPGPSAGSGGRPEERVPMTRLRKRAAERLLSAQHENAILTTFNEVNMHPVMDLRKRYKDQFEKEYGVKLGFMSFFTKAAVEALKHFPVINASVEGEDIIYHGYFDIGMAVSAPRGLVVPVIRDADMLSFADIESKIVEFGQKAHDGKLTMDDLTGGTFTITNGGVFGSMLSTPIINPPQSAILGMHKIQERPMAENGQVVVRPIMYLALSYDHRIIDGREAVQFLVAIKEMIEDPSRLLLQV